MDLVDDEFTALVEDLVGALDKFKVPEKEKGEVLGALGPLKPTMVVGADKLHPIDDAKLAAVDQARRDAQGQGRGDLLERRRRSPASAVSGRTPSSCSRAPR